jgi:hypothetical protein
MKMSEFANKVATTYGELHNNVQTTALQQEHIIQPLTTLAHRCQEMAGAICVNRSIALEAREEHRAVDLHIKHMEKDIRSTKEFLLLPDQGLA